MLNMLKGLLGLNRSRQAGRRHVRARYDAAQEMDDLKRHWVMADAYSADRANSKEVRQILRNRSRYEVANNSYAYGMVQTLANDCIGSGPRLQMLLMDRKTNREIERRFADWSHAVDLPGKLRTMRIALCQDGESFLMMKNNPKLDSPVQLDVQLVEADLITHPPTEFKMSSDYVDGLEYDENGNVRFYYMLSDHPGGWRSSPLEYNRISPTAMIHLFRSQRPGQHRGIPELTPALPLFAMLRRYTLAVLGAAETAADFAGILYSDSTPDDESADADPWDTVEIERRALMTVPAGWKLSQLRAEQPTTTYRDFKHEILNEIARCLNMPFNIAAANSASYNYSSGRLDHQVYFKAIGIDQRIFEMKALDRILMAWFREAVLIDGYLPRSARSIGEVTDHQWFWDSPLHVDPEKEAKAATERLTNKTSNLATEYAKQGRDWEEALRQRLAEEKIEKELRDELGLTEPEPKQAQQADNQKEPEDEEAAA